MSAMRFRSRAKGYEELVDPCFTSDALPRYPANDNLTSLYHARRLPASLSAGDRISTRPFTPASRPDVQ